MCMSVHHAHMYTNLQKPEESNGFPAGSCDSPGMSLGN